jgi:hypothetical protein
MKKYLKVIFLVIIMFGFTAGTVSIAEAKTAPQKKVAKVVKKKKIVAVKKKGTSRLLPAPLIDPNNPPGGL